MSRLPESLLDQIINDSHIINNLNQPFLVVLRHGESEYETRIVNAVDVFDIQDIPLIVGIKTWQKEQKN